MLTLWKIISSFLLLLVVGSFLSTSWCKVQTRSHFLSNPWNLFYSFYLDQAHDNEPAKSNIYMEANDRNISPFTGMGPLHMVVVWTR